METGPEGARVCEACMEMQVSVHVMMVVEEVVVAGLACANAMGGRE